MSLPEIRTPYVLKLSTKDACRVARINRDRFNEHVAAGRFQGAPDTVPGRARLFDLDDMIALCLFVELMEDGHSAEHAGRIACAVGQMARRYPASGMICHFQTDSGEFCVEVTPGRVAPIPALCDRRTRKVTVFNVDKTRKQIAREAEGLWQ